MKKLLFVLAICIAMTSAATALTPGLNIYVNDGLWDGQESVNPSDIITVEIVDTDPSVAFPVSALEHTVSLGDYEADSFEKYSPLSIDTAAVTDAGDGFMVSGSMTTIIGVTQFLSNNAVYRFDFHVPDSIIDPSTIINIDMVSGVYGNVNMGTDSAFDVAMHVVPEPITMSLLGLGGLFLRRRKK